MQSFRLTLINKKLKFYHLFAWLIVLITCIVEGFFALSGEAGKVERFLIVGVFSACLLLLVIFKSINPMNWGRGFLNAAYGLVLIPLLVWKFYWFAATVFIFLLFFGVASRDFSVRVSASYIIYPSFPLKKINWEELSNCLLKDGFLTIDFKNNKIIQQLIDESRSQVNEKEFNEFCKQQLQGSNHQKTNP